MNVIVVDWENGAAMPNYNKASLNIRVVGIELGSFIHKNNIDPKKIHCIGNLFKIVYF